MVFRDYLCDLIGVGVSAGLTFTFYYLFKTGREIVHHLKDAVELEVEPGLILAVREGGGALNACVRGVVKACEEPIHSLARPTSYGVCWRHTIKEHLTSQVFGFWLNDSLPLSTSTNSVPFMLLRKGVGVKISEPGMLEAVDMTIVSEKFDAANSSFLDHVWGWMKGVRTTGTQHTEEMLLEGTSVLGIGRLVLGAEGLCLDPSDSVPYMITTRTKKSLLEDLQAPLPYFRALGMMAALGGAYCVLRMAGQLVEAWKQRRRRRRELRLLEEARARQGTTGATIGESDLPESLMCVVCCGLRDVLLLPCRHMCVCGACALQLPEPRACPVCRTEVESVQPVFYS
ncbi:mitochondrial E3 ubiquitin protein ligase 1-like [Portunus trituberculatus]|uniref:mitochondrial E3 ubiquitin protein ligase 1-like n=1 Tax=Portunus trituberculatus TaxID=210409 RepID=UPI001E1D036A|nr:mitochondrial E3 ubiquitin protein ligase 1-like [Portunus trituberculatus]